MPNLLCGQLCTHKQGASIPLKTGIIRLPVEAARVCSVLGVALPACGVEG